MEYNDSNYNGAFHFNDHQVWELNSLTDASITNAGDKIPNANCFKHIIQK